MLRFRTPANPQVAPYQVRLDGWRGGPLRIAFISDTHAAWPWTTPDTLRRIVARVNALSPDLILHGGDFIAPRVPLVWRAMDSLAATAPFSELRAALGVFCVLGNHDWRDDVEARKNGFTDTTVAAAVDAAGLTLLRNAHRVLSHAGQDFVLAGTDTHQGPGTPRRPQSKADLDRALHGAATGLPTILLAHEPDVIVQSAGRVDVQLSGHTHRGQMDLAGWRPLSPSRLRSGATYGRSEHDGTALIVSAGLGFSGLPLRIAAPPEITLVEIHAPGT